MQRAQEIGVERRLVEGRVPNEMTLGDLSRPRVVSVGIEWEHVEERIVLDRKHVRESKKKSKESADGKGKKRETAEERA